MVRDVHDTMLLFLGGGKLFIKIKNNFAIIFGRQLFCLCGRATTFPLRACITIKQKNAFPFLLVAPLACCGSNYFPFAGVRIESETADREMSAASMRGVYN